MHIYQCGLIQINHHLLTFLPSFDAQAYSNIESPYGKCGIYHAKWSLAKVQNKYANSVLDLCYRSERGCVRERALLFIQMLPTIFKLTYLLFASVYVEKLNSK